MRRAAVGSGARVLLRAGSTPAAPTPQAELVHEDIESALADCRLGKKMRPQTLK